MALSYYSQLFLTVGWLLLKTLPSAPSTTGNNVSWKPLQSTVYVPSVEQVINLRYWTVISLVVPPTAYSHNGNTLQTEGWCSLLLRDPSNVRKLPKGEVESLDRSESAPSLPFCLPSWSILKTRQQSGSCCTPLIHSFWNISFGQIQLGQSLRLIKLVLQVLILRKDDGIVLHLSPS